MLTDKHPPGTKNEIKRELKKANTQEFTPFKDMVWSYCNSSTSCTSVAVLCAAVHGPSWDTVYSGGQHAVGCGWDKAQDMELAVTAVLASLQIAGVRHEHTA